MFFEATEELEVTKDVNRANELLDEGWLFLTTKIDNDHKFIFLMGRHDRPRHEVFACARIHQSTDAIVTQEF